MSIFSGHPGLLKTIIIIVIALIVLGYFGYNVRDIVNSPTVKGNLEYAWSLVVTVWNNYLAAPVLFIWDRIVVDLFWNNLQKFFGGGQNRVETPTSAAAVTVKLSH